MSEFLWGGDRLDLDAYLARIGVAGAAGPEETGGASGPASLAGAGGLGAAQGSAAGGFAADLETLRTLHRAHVAAFPFENLQVLLGRPVLLDVEALQAKMVRQRRGGYCYEQNLLFAAVLERLGFSFTGLGARVRMGSDKLLADTHMLLRISLGDAEWIADVGFGGEGLLEPLPFSDGVQRSQGDWTFGLAREAGPVWVLRSLHPDGWFDLYTFTSEERYPVDYEVRNYYVSTHERSPFVSRPVVQQTEPGARRSLVGARLSFARPDGSWEEREVESDELVDVLFSEFGIELSEADGNKLVQGYASGS
ncbi:arylamine N-acetyltransferase family protein [Streptomyces zagrosensis]|uniref:N-hydroxyarylamine O-acetyltransferase n=1 Tax=Streptomyces zagrosensis TaxID=1042984 RepID=A0A7W9V193_9ACTN|nr:arylamine N-acetyltransferase [Streptomyces zagrosensis]MBB5937544.1 N-hydroxyarylamine O-acetyltransferase [Streptomyces zagrosensis]